tara:strand:- start:1044 stop:1220 length:177 start_codon:yes stop_codon:yes gene_type:complete
MTKLERLYKEFEAAWDASYVAMVVADTAINARDDAKVITNAAWAEYQDELKRVENENT